MKQSSEKLLALLQSNYAKTGSRSMSLYDYCVIKDYDSAVDELIALGYIKQGKYLDYKITLL